MKTQTCLMILFFFAVILHAQDDKEDVTREIGTFNKIEVSGDVVIELIKGEKEKVIIRKAKGVDLDQIDTEVEGNTLDIGSTLPSKKVEVVLEIYYVNLFEIKAYAAAEINCETPLEGERIVFDMNSGAKAMFNLEGEYVEGNVSSGSLLVLKGEVKENMCKISSGGTLDAFELKTERTIIRASTGSVAHVHASERLEAKANTGGFVGYIGDPEEKIFKYNTGGDIVDQKKP